MIEDITGQKFGRLTVIERAENDKKGDTRWKCKCDCGNETIIRGYHLKRGQIKSCGCLLKEVLIKRNTTHGIPDTHPIYRTWQGIKKRCLNNKSIRYDRYGGRGITICDEWKDNFLAFYTWAITHGWKDGLTIDRIDNDGDYCRENCRWVDIETQSNNKSNNVIIELNGEKHTSAEWSRITGIQRRTIVRRISKLGWTVEKALTTPTMEKYRKKVVS